MAEHDDIVWISESIHKRILASKDKRIKELSTECANLLVDSTTAMNNMKKENAALRKERDEATLTLLKEHEQIADLKAEIAKALELGQEYGFDDEGCASCEANHKISDKQDKALKGGEKK